MRQSTLSTQAATRRSDGASSQTALQARGDYLVNHVISCPDCHTPHKARRGSPDLTKFLAGDPVLRDAAERRQARLAQPHERRDRPQELHRRPIKEMFLNGKLPHRRAMQSAALNPYDALLRVSQHGCPSTRTRLSRTCNGARRQQHDPAPRGLRSTSPTPANSARHQRDPAPARDLHGRVTARCAAATSRRESGLCVECHTQHQMAADVSQHRRRTSRGGEDFSALFASTLMIDPVSLNLTSDTATGLGTWGRDGHRQRSLAGQVQGRHGHLPAHAGGAHGRLRAASTADDAMDIANYIKSLPPIHQRDCRHVRLSRRFRRPDGGTDALMSEAGSDASSGDALRQLALSAAAPRRARGDRACGR